MQMHQSPIAALHYKGASSLNFTKSLLFLKTNNQNIGGWCKAASRIEKHIICFVIKLTKHFLFNGYYWKFSYQEVK